MSWTSAALVTSVPSVAFACSGRGAEALMERNYWLGLKLWSVAVVLAAWAWLIGASGFSMRQRALLTLIVVIHPGCWMDVLGGDCGFARRDGAVAATLFSFVLIAYAAWMNATTLRDAAPTLGLTVLPAAGLYVMFSLFQGGFRIAGFDAASLAVLMDDWLSSDHWARGEAARTHWLASLYVASALLIAVAVLSLAIIGRRWLRWLVAAIGLGLVLSIWGLVPTLQRTELGLARMPDIPDPLPLLTIFLGGAVSTIALVVVAVAHAVERVRETEPSFTQALGSRSQGAVAESEFGAQHAARLKQLHQASDSLRGLLALTTSWLVSGVIGIALLHRWPWAALPERAVDVLRPLGTASTVFTGAFYSCLLCAVFLPTELYLRRAAYELAATARGGTLSRSELRKWLEEEGFDLSTRAALTQLSTIFAPLIAGVLQGVAAF